MEKRKIRFNIIDVLIILAIVAVVAVFSYFAAGKWETGKAENTSNVIEYTLEVSDAEEKFCDKIAEGDLVWDVRKGGALGEVVAVEEAKPQETVKESAEKGEFVMSEIPGKYSYRFTVKSPCSASAAGYSINDTKVVVGSKITLRTKNVAVTGTVMKVNPVEAAQ